MGAVIGAQVLLNMVIKAKISPVTEPPIINGATDCGPYVKNCDHV